MLTSEEQDILSKLEKWAARADAVVNAFGTEQPPTAAAASNAKVMYSSFKDQLRDESLALEGRMAKGELTVAEQQWYQPTIYEALIHLRAAKNASAGPEMFSSISDAYSDFTHMIASMRGVDANAAGTGTVH